MPTNEELLDLVRPIDAAERILFDSTVAALRVCLPLEPSEEELHADVETALNEAGQ